MSAFCPPLLHRASSVAAALIALGACAGISAAAEPCASNPLSAPFALVFDSEFVRLDVVGDTLEVRTSFVLLCRTPVDTPTALFYPFPEDSLLGAARMVSLAFRAGDGPAVPADWEETPDVSGVRWWVPPCLGDSIVADAVYRQRIKTEYARYIVTTARLWGRPLRVATFEIRLPPGAEPVGFSYPFERREEGGEVLYVYRTECFFPDRDIVVRWRP